MSNSTYTGGVTPALPPCELADFDDETVNIDRQTLNPEDFAKIRELLKFCPVKFCMSLKAAFGDEEAERTVAESFAMARDA